MVPMWCSFLDGAGAWGKYGEQGGPLHTQSGDPVQRLSLGGAGLLDLRGPAQYVRGAHRDDRAGHSRHSREQSGHCRWPHRVPRLRAGFIDAPSNGPPIVPQAMMYAPTASGTNGPFSLGPLARLRIMSTRPKVMMASNPAACQDWPGLGMVAARCPAGPKNPRTSRDPQMAAANCTIQYQPAITQPMSRRSAKAKVVAGLTWAEMSPRK